MLSSFIQKENNVEEFDFVETFEQVIAEGDDFDDLSDLQLFLSSNNNFIDGLLDMNAFNVAVVHVNISNTTHDSQNDSDYEDIFTFDDILA